MTPHPWLSRSLPYLVAALGIILSLLLWYCFGSYHIWIDVSFGIGLSLLTAVSIRIAQIAKQRAITLKKTNEELKNEIVERIQVEETKQKLEVALLQGQKLQAIGTLAGGIAHDFNNLLYAIIGYVEMARDEVAKDSITYKNLGKVLEATERGRDLVASILAFSRRQQQHFQPIHLTKTIDAALALLRPTIPASVIIQFEPETDAIILGNQTQIHQVLVNMINNAVDAMDGEGTINLRVTAVPKQDALLKQFPGILPQDYCKIEVTDEGFGMDQPTVERIFEPFFTTKEVGKGTGLGLSIVHTIIKDHQGEITVNSQLGKGTVFVILLPTISAEITVDNTIHHS